MNVRSVVREVLDRIHRDRPAAERDADDRALVLAVCRSQGVEGVDEETSFVDAARKLAAHLEAGAQDEEV